VLYKDKEDHIRNPNLTIVGGPIVLRVKHVSKTSQAGEKVRKTGDQAILREIFNLFPD